jgi:hypothetical protein
MISKRVEKGKQMCIQSGDAHRLHFSHWCDSRAVVLHGEREANAFEVVVLAPPAALKLLRQCHIIQTLYMENRLQLSSLSGATTAQCVSAQLRPLYALQLRRAFCRAHEIRRSVVLLQERMHLRAVGRNLHREGPRDCPG